ncbi:MAG: sigma-70 family RNA polymerase sigma factor [Acidobacteria bacterium]|nr:sigma-70 family RNA polymerase sigma factor [Acidobacteriota bacterium]
MALPPGRALAMTDEQIVQMTVEGEVEAFGLLVQRWERKVYGLALRMLGHAEDARDVSQEVFLTVFRNLPKFRGEARFSSWLYRIALNCCHNRLRDRGGGMLPLEETSAIQVEDAVLGRIESTQAVRRVRAALRALPAEMRLVIIMKEYEDLTFNEIAEILNIPVSTAKTRLYAGLDQLRKRLAGMRGAL